MKKKELIIAVDFDGTLCNYDFPKIGNQDPHHEQLMKILINLRKKGHKLILWTNRGDNDEYKSLTEAIQWCKERGLEFDSINQNLPNQKKLSGYSPKIMADYYIDDKCLEFNTNINKDKTINTLLSLLK